MTAGQSAAADTLRDELLALEVDKYPLFTEYQIDQIMPGVLRFADAQVAAERERIARAQAVGHIHENCPCRRDFVNIARGQP